MTQNLNYLIKEIEDSFEKRKYLPPIISAINDLQREILFLSILDYHKKSSIREYQEAYRFFYGENQEENPFSFEEICYHLDLSPSRIRKNLNNLTNEDLFTYLEVKGKKLARRKEVKSRSRNN